MPVRMDRTSPLSSGLDPLSGCSQDSARPALAAVYDQIPQGKGFGGSGRRPPAQVRPGPGGQLSGRERVRHVVAGFRIEGPGDDLILPMPGYGDDRHIGHAADGQPPRSAATLPPSWSPPSRRGNCGTGPLAPSSTLGPTWPIGPCGPGGPCSPFTAAGPITSCAPTDP